MIIDTINNFSASSRRQEECMKVKLVERYQRIPDVPANAHGCGGICKELSKHSHGLPVVVGAANATSELLSLINYRILCKSFPPLHYRFRDFHFVFIAVRKIMNLFPVQNSCPNIIQGVYHNYILLYRVETSHT